MASPKELLREIERRQVDCVIADYHALTEQGERAALAVATHAPAIPLVCWRGIGCLAPNDARTAPAVGLDDDSALAEFVHAEVVSVARGRLSGVSLPSVLQVLQMEQRSCRLRVRAGPRLGELFIRTGTLVHAIYQKRSPRESALEMLGWVDADVVFDRLPMATVTTINESMDFLLLESARMHDENPSLSTRALAADTKSTPGSTANWLLPALLRGDSDALVSEVLALPSANVAAVIDIENRLLVAYRSKNGKAIARLNSSIPDGLGALNVLLLDMDLRDWTEDILVTVASQFLLLRPLRAAPNLVLFGAFDRSGSTLGMIRSQLAQLAQTFGLRANTPAT